MASSNVMASNNLMSNSWRVGRKMNNHTNRNRNGAVVPIFAILISILFILVVFAIDFGVIIVARHQLQNAADASAMSTLQVLARDRESADVAAAECLENNLVWGKSTLADVPTDVTYGNWDSDERSFTEIPRRFGDVPEGASAVRVILERSTERGNAVSLFFAPIFGLDFANIRAESIASATAGCSGFVGIESIRLANNINTDSYDSRTGSYGGSNRAEHGDVCSNGPVNLSSGADVFGNAAGSSVNISQGSGATVSGSTTNSPSAGTYPAVDFSLATPNDNDTIERGPTWAPPFYNASTRDMVVNNGRSVTLQAGTYYFRKFNLAGGSRLNINGEVEIYVDNALTFDNGTVANQSQIPSNLKLFVGAGPVNLQGGHQLHAVIYSPTADVRIANGSGFFGSIIGNTLDVQGANMHFDEALRTEASSGGAPTLVQ